MDEALLELLDEKELPYITVKEICARAGVSRSTFYLHYETIGDLLTECTESMNRRFRDFMGESRHDFVESIPQRTRDELYLITPEYLVRYLEFVREHRQLYRTALEHAEALQLTRVYDRMYEGVITPILDRCRGGRPRPALHHGLLHKRPDSSHIRMAERRLRRLGRAYREAHAAMRSRKQTRTAKLRATNSSEGGLRASMRLGYAPAPPRKGASELVALPFARHHGTGAL